MLTRIFFSVMLCVVAMNASAQSYCEQHTLFLRTSLSDWKAEPMHCQKSGALEIEVNAQKGFVFKFDQFADWKVNFGDNDKDGVLDQSGKTILVESAGAYLITVEFDAEKQSLVYDITEQELISADPCGSPALSLRQGSYAWAAKQMYCSEDKVWVTEVTALNDDQLVFDVNGDWTLVYGDQEGDMQLDVSGAYISIPEAGVYQVHVDLINQQYYIVSTELVGNQDFIPENECGLEQLYLRGSHNDWQTDALTCEDGVWEAQIYFDADDIFRFDAYGDWTEIWGDNEVDGVLDDDGKNISVSESGEYLVKVNFIEKTYQFELMQ